MDYVIKILLYFLLIKSELFINVNLILSFSFSDFLANFCRINSYKNIDYNLHKTFYPLLSRSCYLESYGHLSTSSRGFSTKLPSPKLSFKPYIFP